MKTVSLGSSGLTVPSIVLGCMRIGNMEPQALNRLIHTAMDNGANYFDHADIYGGGKCETIFGSALKADPSLRREDMIIQSKLGICPGDGYDSSKEHILESVDKILGRLQLDYLDALLIHRPDALVEPEEVAEAFDILHASGKVRFFGVSNHRPMQIELLKKYVRQPLMIDQMQFSIPASGMIAGGMEVNTEGPGAADRDGSVLDYCRLNDITIQAWSPFQRPSWQGPFIGSDACPELNEMLNDLAGTYGVTPTAIAAAWIFRHPAGIQLITGSTSPNRLAEILAGQQVHLTRKEWYGLYRAAGHPIP